jgi:hypothetical protein
MDWFGVATGAALIIGALYVATNLSQVGEGIHEYYVRVQANQKRAYRGRWAWLAKGYTPSVRQSTVLGGVLVLASVGLGIKFILESL